MFRFSHIRLLSSSGWRGTVHLRDIKSKDLFLCFCLNLCPFFSRSESDKVSEMFDNPLYGSVEKSHARGKDQDHPQRDHLAPPDAISSACKPADRDPERPPVPTPRIRSFTCSETKPQPPNPVTSHSTMHKKPVVPSRSEGGMAHNRPPLPSKFRLGLPESQTPKSRDYRDSSELLAKHRPPARPGQPQLQRDSKENSPFAIINFIVSYEMQTLYLSLAYSDVAKVGRSVK